MRCHGTPLIDAQSYSIAAFLPVAKSSLFARQGVFLWHNSGQISGSLAYGI